MMGRDSGESRLTNTACLMGLGVKARLDCKRHPDDLQPLIPSHRLATNRRLKSQVFGTRRGVTSTTKAGASIPTA